VAEVDADEGFGVEDAGGAFGGGMDSLRWENDAEEGEAIGFGEFTGPP
jgi:hypothetical protein